MTKKTALVSVIFGLVAGLVVVGAVFFGVTRVTQNDTGGTGSQYLRSTNPSFLSTVIFGILSIKKHVQPLTLAAMEASNKPLVLKPPYADAAVLRQHTGGIDLISVCDNQADKHHIIYYIHGGAWASGLNDRYVTFALTLSQKTKYCVLLPEYSLLPASRFPAALDELQAAYAWVLQTDQPNKVVFGGDSSGANLSPALIFSLEQQHLPLPNAQFLLSPLVDLTLSSPTFKTKASLDPLQSEGFVRDAVNAYAGHSSSDLTNPLVSPIYGDFHAYPPTIIEVGDQEIFLGDSVNLYTKITNAGSEAQLDVWKGLWHAFPIVVNVPESQQALNLIAQYIRAHD